MKTLITIIIVLLFATSAIAGSVIVPKQDADRKAIVDAYQSAITDLQTIKNVTNPTNAQVIWAIKRMADIQEKELKYLKSLIDKRK